MQNIRKMATAHTRDDQAETVLMRLLRGTGISGLGAMRPKTMLEGIVLIRPLLETGKTEIVRYLRGHAFKWRTDSTNLVSDCFRNKVRLEVLPFLEGYSPHIKDNLFRLAENAQETEAFVMEAVKRSCNRLVKQRANGHWCLAKKPFLTLLPLQRKSVIREIISRLLGTVKGYDAKHIYLIDEFIAQQGNTGKRIDLPKGLSVKQGRECAVFLKKRFRGEWCNSGGITRLAIGKRVVAPALGYAFTTEIVRGPVRLKRHGPLTEYFDRDVVSQPLCVRTRRNGDVVYPLGIKGKKKLKKFFIDAKVEGSDKDAIPLVVSGNDILWVVGLRISEKYKVGPATKTILRITAKRISKSSNNAALIRCARRSN